MPASLNDINRSIGELTSSVRGLSELVAQNEQRNVTAIASAEQSRREIHRRLDEMVTRVAHVESEVLAVKSDVGAVVKRTDTIQNVTDEVRAMRERAVGAGTLGRWVIVIGQWVVAGAAGFAAAYTWLTGRPPP